MRATKTVQKILRNYEGETPGVKANLCRMLMEGSLGGTGKMIILPVDQGFEHGPARTFAREPGGYDPHYHYQLAIDAGLNAYAAPLGMLEAGADTFAGQIPTILKVNSANSLMSETAGKNQAITGVVDGRAAAGMCGHRVHDLSGQRHGARHVRGNLGDAGEAAAVGHRDGRSGPTRAARR